mgnify:CR=1 FL=1
MSYKYNKRIVELIDSLINERETVDNTFQPGITTIPPSGKCLDNSEIKFMIEASLDGWLTTGRFNDMFEKKLSEYIEGSGGGQNFLSTAGGKNLNGLQLVRKEGKSLLNDILTK